jgi:hypothetical protein
MSTTAPLKITWDAARDGADFGILPTFAGGRIGVNSRHGVHEAAARRGSERGNHVQRAVLDASARASWGAIPVGGRRD